MADVTCPAEEVLSAWLDGAATLPERRMVDAHLPSCPACTATLVDLGEVRSLVRGLPSVEPPPGLLPGGHADGELSAFLDGELPTGEVEVLTGHLAHCAECRGRLQDVDAARTAIRALPRLEPPDGLLPGVPAAAGRRRHRLGLGVAVAGAAAVMAAFVLVRGPAPVTVDPVELASRHGVRSAVDPGLSLPVFELPGDTG